MFLGDGVIDASVGHIGMADALGIEIDLLLEQRRRDGRQGYAGNIGRSLYWCQESANDRVKRIWKATRRRKCIQVERANTRACWGTVLARFSRNSSGIVSRWLKGENPIRSSRIESVALSRYREGKCDVVEVQEEKQSVFQDWATQLEPIVV